MGNLTTLQKTLARTGCPVQTLASFLLLAHTSAGLLELPSCDHLPWCVVGAGLPQQHAVDRPAHLSAHTLEHGASRYAHQELIGVAATGAGCQAGLEHDEVAFDLVTPQRLGVKWVWQHHSVQGLLHLELQHPAAQINTHNFE